MAFNILGFGSGLFNKAMDEFFPDPAKKAMPYLNQVPGTISPYFEPYIGAGQRALPTMESEYGKLTSDPGARMNEIGGSFQQSPGFKFALDQALQGAGHAAAAGGMAGSPAHERTNMDIATQLGNQDFNNWMSRALGLYGKGLGGEEDIYKIGAGAGMGLGENLAQNIMSKAGLSYAGQANRNQLLGGLIGNIISASTKPGGM